MHYEIPVVLHNFSNYDYHFIIKELVKEFEEKFECHGKNTEKYKNFFAPNLVDNLAEGIHKT